MRLFDFFVCMTFFSLFINTNVVAESSDGVKSGCLVRVAAFARVHVEITRVPAVLPWSGQMIATRQLSLWPENNRKATFSLYFHLLPVRFFFLEG